MKNYLLLFVALFIFSSCDNEKVSAMHPDFEKNKATWKSNAKVTWISPSL